MWTAVALAVVVTIVNAFKPPQMDDTCYIFNARQVLKDPLDPEGFSLFYFQWPLDCRESPLLPVMPYWLAGVMALCGESMWAMRMSMLPFALCFTLSYGFLLQRYAPRLARPLLVGVTLSPVILPGINLMLDLPAMGLILGSIATFIHAMDRNSTRLALLAGVLGGIAILTKYTGAMAPAVFLTIAFSQRRLSRGIMAACVALAIYASWEGLYQLRYGVSPFIGTTKAFPFGFKRAQLALDLFGTVGFIGLSWLPLLFGIRHPSISRFMWPLTPLLVVLTSLMQVGEWPYRWLGAIWFAAVFSVVRPELISHLQRWRSVNVWIHDNPTFIILLIWTLGELAGYFVMSPFCAVRRVIGLMIAAMLLVGHCAQRASREQPTTGQSVHKWCRVSVALNICLGLFCFGMDAYEAWLEQRLVIDAQAEIQKLDPNRKRKIWFVGHWAFHYDAERAGMRPVIPEWSQLRQGDWMLVPKSIYQQVIRIDAPEMHLMKKLEYDDPVRCSTFPNLYSGGTPLIHREDDVPRLSGLICQLQMDYIPESGFHQTYVNAYVDGFAETSIATFGSRAVARGLFNTKSDIRIQSAFLLARLGGRAIHAGPYLRLALEDSEPEVRIWSVVALASIDPNNKAQHRLVLQGVLRETQDPKVREMAQEMMTVLDRL